MFVKVTIPNDNKTHIARYPEGWPAYLLCRTASKNFNTTSGQVTCDKCKEKKQKTLKE